MSTEKPCMSSSEWLKDMAVIGFDLNTEFNSLHTVSSEVESRGCFVALVGDKFDGREFIPEAASRGAALAVYDPAKCLSPNIIDWLKNSGTNTVVIPVPELENKLSFLASKFYQHPSRQMLGIGVTGTNGKSSVAYMLASALTNQKRKTGLIGTLGYGTVNQLTSSRLTTPNAVQTQKYLADFVEKGFDSFVFEASSHGLALGRVSSVSTDVAVMTHFGSDHNDFHKSRSEYLAAKEILFANSCRANVLNFDDPYSEVLLDKYTNVESIGYSIKKKHDSVPTVLASNIKVDLNTVNFRVSSTFGNSNLSLPLSGAFQVENALAVLTAQLIAGCDFEVACDALSRVQHVPGRMNWFELAEGPKICVDYAHNAESLASVLSHIKTYATGKVWCVFGCGGDRDASRRAAMGKVAERYSDNIILTDDNPRSESPEKIIQDITDGMLCKWAVMVEHDRSAAIAHAINNASKNDIILIAGKGHETYQEIANDSVWYSDIEQVLSYLDSKEVS